MICYLKPLYQPLLRRLFLLNSSAFLRQDPRYCYSADDRIYFQGAALTHTLIEQFGVEKFRELFSVCEPETFADHVRRIYDMTIEELDTFYWREIENDFSFDRATKDCSDEEKALLEEYRLAWQKQNAAYHELFGNSTIDITTRIVSDTKTELEETVYEFNHLFRSREDRFFRIDIKTHTNEEEDYPYDLLTRELILPDRMFSVNQWACPQYYEDAMHSGGRYLSDHRMARFYLQQYTESFSPDSLLDDQTLTTLLWTPLPELTVKRVARRNDGLVVITIQDDRDSTLAQYRLTVDPSQNWLLREVKWMKTPQLLSGTVMKETRNYEGEYRGTPLLKSVLIEKTVFRWGIGESKQTTNRQFTRIDPVAAPESVFTEKSLGVGLIPVEGLPTQPYRRMNRHQILIVAWLLVSTAIIMAVRRRNRHRTISNESQSEMLQGSEYCGGEKN